MTYLNLARYLDEYRGKFPVFSDDIQGATATRSCKTLGHTACACRQLRQYLGRRYKVIYCLANPLLAHCVS